MVYHNHLYNFEKIIYAYNQGPGFLGPNADAEPTGNAYLNFIFSYDGAVAAFNQFLFNLGEDSDTEYQNEIGYTTPGKVMSTISNIGLNVSERSFDRSIGTIVEELNAGKLIGMYGIARYEVDEHPVTTFFTKGFPMWAVDGCDVIVDGYGNPLTGMIHCVWGVFGLGDGFFSYPVFLSENRDFLSQVAYFSVN